MRVEGIRLRPADPESNEVSLIWQPGILLAEPVYTNGELRFVAQETGKEVETLEEVRGYKPIPWLAGAVQRSALYLPSGVMEYGTSSKLAERIRSFIAKYFDCDPQTLSVLLLYVLMTWLYELFDAVPYMRFLGMSGIGKSRACRVLAAISNRGLMISGSTTPAVIFRQIEMLGGTLAIDEADFQHTGIGSELAKILNGGFQKGTPVPRNEKNMRSNWVPHFYDVFGPKLLNGRHPFHDDATESRCLTHIPSPTQRADIKKHLPPSFDDEALEIRNQALQWRFNHLDTFVFEELSFGNLRPRTDQILMPLINVARLIGGISGEDYEKDLREFATLMEHQAKQDQKDTLEALLIQAYLDLVESDHAPSCMDVAERAKKNNGGADSKLESRLDAREAGRILRGLGFSTHHTRRGAELSINSQRLADLRKRFDIHGPPNGAGRRFPPA